MFTKVKGTYDLLPKDAKKLSHIENYLKEVASLYGYQEIRVPILASSDLIHRSTGESSDIVSKETYDFIDRGDRPMTLRPEGTAPVIRAIIENKMYANYPLPLKLFYYGDMFRYERPQKGRFREFRQFGVEVVGTNSPYMDAEVITLASTIFNSLRINNYYVRLNTLGDDESRTNYRNALKEYFKDKLDSLCADCKRRYETNPLRILDCKADKDNEVLLNAPKISDYLSDNSKAEFELVKSYLDTLKIPYVIDEQLVRGLDYYTNTIFEFVLKDNTLGQSGTICAGGRYNKLTKDLDGPELGSIGFAFGLERLMEIIDERVDYSHKLFCQLIPIGLNAKINMIKLMQILRVSGFSCDMNYEANSLKGHFKSSENNNVRFILIQGDEELATHSIKIKDKIQNTEEIISEEDLMDYMIKRLRCSNKSCENCEGDCGNEN
ncbi:histidine--tRNA ligase [bacterium]|nr:histidine--tRNA ligase [bacterium]